MAIPRERAGIYSCRARWPAGNQAMWRDGVDHETYARLDGTTMFRHKRSEPMMSVPFPADTLGLSADPDGSAPPPRHMTAATVTTSGSLVMTGKPYGKMRSILRQSFCAAAHFAVQSGA